MAKQILRRYLINIDNLKNDITNEADQLLKVIDINKLLSLNTEQKKQYLTEMLMDFWEAQDKKIDKAIKMGEDKAELLISATE